MANAAPYVAQPLRRIVAGVLDLVVLLFFVILAVAALGDARPSEQIAAALATYGLYHAAFLSILDGATPAQRAFDMRIVSARSGDELSVGQTFLRSMFRPMFIYAIGWTAVLVSPPPSILAMMLVAPLLVEVGMMFTLPARQTLADLVARTLVINVPPPQPHRAPAAPMYSATDAEFGVRPRRIRRVAHLMQV
jgi:uncharacterized RDD family membrane protein YckC